MANKEHFMLAKVGHGTVNNDRNLMYVIFNTHFVLVPPTKKIVDIVKSLRSAHGEDTDEGDNNNLNGS